LHFHQVGDFSSPPQDLSEPKNQSNGLLCLLPTSRQLLGVSICFQEFGPHLCRIVLFTLKKEKKNSITVQIFADKDSRETLTLASAIRGFGYPNARLNKRVSGFLPSGATSFPALCTRTIFWSRLYSTGRLLAKSLSAVATRRCPHAREARGAYHDAIIFAGTVFHPPYPLPLGCDRHSASSNSDGGRFGTCDNQSDDCQRRSWVSVLLSDCGNELAH
jgi:hypothetical protein